MASNMTSNLASNIAQDMLRAEAGGYLEQAQSEGWWVAKWASTLATLGAVALAFFSVLAMAFNILTPLTVIAGFLYLVASALILAIEGSSVVSFLKFAKPVGVYFEGRGLLTRTITYALLAVIPFILGSGLAITFCFVIACSITSLYGMIIIGRKGSVEDMKAAAGQPGI